MTRTMSTPDAARRPWRALLTTVTLVGALVASGAAVPANAEVFTDGPGTLSGSVTNTDGLAVANVLVNASINAGPGEGTPWGVGVWTDADGHYELVGIPLGNYDISANATGYQAPLWQSATLTESSPGAVVNFVVAPYAIGVGTIAGQVTLDGVPLAGQFVAAHNYASGQNFNTTTDGDGFYQFTELSNGEWYVSSSVSEAQPLYPLAVEITDSSPTVTFHLPYLSWPVGTSTISGVVTDSETGEPLTDLSIYLYGLDVAHSSGTSSGGTGAYAFGQLPEGTYQLSLWSIGYLYSQQEVHVLAGEDLTVDLGLVAADSTISGHVTGPDGLPAVATYVSAYSSIADGGSGGGTETDANGNYVITDLGPLDYTVTVGGVGTPFEPQDKVVTAVAHGDVTADFTVTPRTTGYFSGTVVDEDGWWIQTAVCATLYSSKSKKPLANVATWGEEFGDGSWAFDKVKPGSYTVEFRDCDDDPATKFDKVFLGGVKNYKDATFVTIVAGQDSFDNSVTLTLRNNNGHP